MKLHQTRAEDVSAASAAYAFNVLGEIAKLPPPEGFRRLYDLFHTAILAYVECRHGWGVVPEPSVN